MKHTQLNTAHYTYTTKHAKHKKLSRFCHLL